jgi:alkanesulfonate monooxygenase SsuD/methylene tetrahydromethanopterin reductase-like flavin-dependent oxidoreductase (luciferase family)
MSAPATAPTGAPLDAAPCILYVPAREGARVHFGVFVEEMRRGNTHADAFREAFELVDAAERWGLDGVWLGELHFNPARCAMSAPMVVATAIASRTRRLRVGTAVHVLPLSHPLRIAEEVATLDLLSGGRFDFGVGRSGAARTYDGFGVPYAESQARFREALHIIVQAWKGAPFSYEGQFYRVKNVAISPQPVQQPHPPIRMAANTPETFRGVGRDGLRLFVGLRGLDIVELAEHIRSYRAAWREAGHPGDGDVYLRIPVYAAETETAALDEPRESISYYFERQAELARAGMGRGDVRPAEGRPSQAERLASLTYEEILDQRVAFGTAATLGARLKRLRDELGLDGVVMELNSGGLLSMEQVMRSLRIVASEVMPPLH